MDMFSDRGSIPLWSSIFVYMVGRETQSGRIPYHKYFLSWKKLLDFLAVFLSIL